MFKKNYWPQVIVLMIIGAIVASVWTIKIAVTNPVQQSNLFLANYHITDSNINQILINQISFNSKYKLDYSKTTLSEENLHGEFIILDNGKKIDAEFEIIITRPEMVKFDTTISDNIFDFKIPQLGRWHVYVKATVENLDSYFYFELDTRKLTEIKVMNPFISHKKIEKVAKEREDRIKNLISE